MDVQQVGSKAPNRCIQREHESRTYRRVQPATVTGNQRDINAGNVSVKRAVRTRFGVCDKRGPAAVLLKAGAQVGADTLNASGMWRKELSDMQNAHGAWVNPVFLQKVCGPSTIGRKCA